MEIAELLQYMLTYEYESDKRSVGHSLHGNFNKETYRNSSDERRITRESSFA